MGALCGYLAWGAGCCRQPQAPWQEQGAGWGHQGCAGEWGGEAAVVHLFLQMGMILSIVADEFENESDFSIKRMDV